MRNLRPQDERSARQWRCDAATGEGGDRAGKGAGGKGFDEFRVVGHVGWILLDNSPSPGHPKSSRDQLWGVVEVFSGGQGLVTFPSFFLGLGTPNLKQCNL